MQEQDQPSTLALGMEGLSLADHTPCFDKLGFGEAGLVQGRWAAVPVVDTGRWLYREQWRASVGRIGFKTNLPTDAPFLWLPFVATCGRPT